MHRLIEIFLVNRACKPLFANPSTFVAVATAAIAATAVAVAVAVAEAEAVAVAAVAATAAILAAFAFHLSRHCGADQAQQNDHTRNSAWSRTAEFVIVAHFRNTELKSLY
ncbi:hypothetical protein HZH68_015121 [Vespula germanica]|uniref:Uncharacterized protein n=1 Tax=Vespula germanica TaxID=30212 RepID=A0A834J8A8_VESGE|nr:hypothetical protein HZH68_015121 [Vespula germanica]